jgi:hypothetical protein
MSDSPVAETFDDYHELSVRQEDGSFAMGSVSA